METSFAERLKLAMDGGDGYPKVSQTTLAKGLKLTQQAVSLWLKGDAEGMRMKYLFPVARRLGVRPEWLAAGTPPMRELNPKIKPSELQPLAVAETLRWCTYLVELVGGTTPPREVEVPYSELSSYFISTYEALVADGGTASPDTASKLLNQATERATAREDKKHVEPAPGSPRIRGHRA